MRGHGSRNVWRGMDGLEGAGLGAGIDADGSCMAEGCRRGAAVDSRAAGGRLAAAPAPAGRSSRRRQWCWRWSECTGSWPNTVAQREQEMGVRRYRIARRPRGYIGPERVCWRCNARLRPAAPHLSGLGRKRCRARRRRHCPRHDGPSNWPARFQLPGPHPDPRGGCPPRRSRLTLSRRSRSTSAP